MHQSPQKLIGTRRERNAVYAAFEMADDAIERRPSRGGGQPRARKAAERDDLPRQERPARSHPRG
jgi:hypothetical protein